MVWKSPWTPHSLYSLKHATQEKYCQVWKRRDLFQSWKTQNRGEFTVHTKCPSDPLSTRLKDSSFLAVREVGVADSRLGLGLMSVLSQVSEKWMGQARRTNRE